MVVDVATLTRVGVVVTALAALGFGLSLVGRKRVEQTLTDRFVYGVPWGSLLVVGGVFAFYLFAQGGLHHWSDPVTLPFRNWAYPYVTGMLSSGFAHGGPGHLLGNMLATVVLAPLAEFIWGHYPHERDSAREKPGRPSPKTVPSSPELAEFDETSQRGGIPSGHAVTDGSTGTATSENHRSAVEDRPSRFRDRPFVRAVVVFPGMVLFVSLLTSLYALGWSLGFSGTVFAFLGFVLLKYPIATALSLLGVSLLNTLVNTILIPVLRATAEAGPPEPPGWAGVNVQAHMLGFLVGILLALALLWDRDEQPDPTRLLLATVLVVAVQGLWQLSTVDDGVFVRYQGLGVVFVLLLAVLVTYVTASENSALSGWTPTLVRGFAALWVVGVVAAAAGAVLVFGADLMTVLAVVALAPAAALPAIVLTVPDAVLGWSMSTRRLLFASLLLVTVVIALPSVAGNAVGIDGDAVPEDGLVVEDYRVDYVENATHGRTGGTDSGLVVASERRYVWSVTVSEDVLEHDGSASVPLGGVGWREDVRVERTGWEVVGNDSAYVVDLETDETTVRSFVSAPSRAVLTLADRNVTVVPTDEGFVIDVTRDGESLGTAPLPETNETAHVGPLAFTTEVRDEEKTLVASTEDSSVTVARRS